jgi:hypothetical protein
MVLPALYRTEANYVHHVGPPNFYGFRSLRSDAFMIHTTWPDLYRRYARGQADTLKKARAVRDPSRNLE